MKKVLLFAIVLFLTVSTCFAKNYSKIPIWGGEIGFAELCVSSPTTIYAGSGGTGVFVTKNGGLTWEMINSEGANAIGVHSTLPNIVLLASPGSTNGNKLYRSEDYGKTWTEIWGTSEAYRTIQVNVKRIVPSIKTPGTFYLLGNCASPLDGVLYKSVDAGLTWTKTSFTSSGKQVLDTCVDANDNIYIASRDKNVSFDGNTSQSTSNSGKFFKSSDGGNNFITVLSISAYPEYIAYSSGVVAMATTMTMLGTDSGIYISTDAFTTNTKVSGKNKLAISYDGTKIYYFAPVLACTELSSGTWKDGVYIASNACLSAQYILTDPVNSNIMYAIGSGSFASNDDGILKSTDTGNTWFAANTGLGGLMVYNGCKDTTGNMYIIGSASAFKGTNNGTVWTKVFSPDLGKQYDPGAKQHNMSYAVIAAPAPNYVFTGTAGDLWRSTDNATTWTMVFSTNVGGNYSLGNCEFTNKIVFNKNNPAIGYMGFKQTGSSTMETWIYKTADYGLTWTKLNLTGTNHVQVMEIDPSDPTKIYVGLGIASNFVTCVSGGLWKIVDDGISAPTWSQIGLAEWVPYCISVSTNGAIIAACIKYIGGNYMSRETNTFYSLDGGITWNEVNFEKVSDYYQTNPVDIEFSDDLFYAASLNGIFVAGSADATFKPIVSGEDVGNIRCLVVGSMYSGTEKGFFKIIGGIEKLTQTIEKPKLWGFPNPYKPASGNITLKYSVPQGRNAKLSKISIYNIAGELVNEITDTSTLAGGFSYLFSWNGTNTGGESCASGIYIVIIKSDIDTTKTKIALVR